MSFFFSNFSLAIVVVLLLLIALVSAVPLSLAHPFYIDSTPRASQNIPTVPREVSVFFSEPIELSYSKISVIGSDGNRVDEGDAYNVDGDSSSIATMLKPNLPNGIYTVNTKVLSAIDGHVVDNSFTYGVGTEISESSKTPGIGVGSSDGAANRSQSQKDILSPEESASRFPGYVGQVIAFGAAFGSLWLWKPFNQIPWLSQSLLRYRISVSKAATKIVIIGSSLVFFSGIAMIIVQSFSLGADIQQIILTKFGNVWSIRMIQASVLMLLAFGLYRKNSKGDLVLNKAELIAILALALSLLVTNSLIAHAAATNQALAILGDFFHSVAASIWIGGLIFLAFAAVPKLSRLVNDDTTKAATLSILIPRFSTIIVVILGIIVATGPLLLWTLESDLEITIASLYGKILLVKLFIGSLMIGLGAYHQFLTEKKVTQFLVSSITNGKTTTSVAKIDISKNLTRFDRTLKTEGALGIGLLFMVSLMANMALPSGEFPSYEQINGESNLLSTTFAVSENTKPTSEFSQVAYIQNGKILLIINPYTIGQNTFQIFFSDLEGNDAASINSSSIKLTQIEKGIGPLPVDTTKKSPGKFEANAAFSLPGRWIVEVQGETTIPDTPNMVTRFDVLIKPKLADLKFTMDEFRTPQESLLLYPIYDSLTRSIWVGDTKPGSGRMWQFNIDSKNYTMHSINNTSLITISSLDREGNVWYTDPTKTLIGKYNPLSKENQQLELPVKGIISGLAIDHRNTQNVWITVGGQSNKIVQLDPRRNQFNIYNIPSQDSRPTGIAVDRQGSIWFSESAGKVGRLDPDTGNVTQYEPTEKLLEDPTAVLPDPTSSRIYISEHEGKAITVLDPVLNLFHRYSIISKGGLPFGLALDSYDNVWFAQHVIDKVGVLDPSKRQMAEVSVRTIGSFVQWLSPDDQGRIWFAEQRGSALGSISIVLNPSTSSSNVASVIQADEKDIGSSSNEENTKSSTIPDLKFGFADILGPLVATGIIIAAFLYSKNILNLKSNIIITKESQQYPNK